jgi:iron complex outermembrane receptor protein
MYARRRTIEAFGEVNVTLLRDLPFVHRLSIEGAFRYSHYMSLISRISAPKR